MLTDAGLTLAAERSAEVREPESEAGPVISDHALQRMAERNIAVEDVRIALSRRITTEPGQPGSVWIHGWTQGGGVLKVCVRVEEQNYVITAAWRWRRR